MLRRKNMFAMHNKLSDDLKISQQRPCVVNMLSAVCSSTIAKYLMHMHVLKHKVKFLPAFDMRFSARATTPKVMDCCDPLKNSATL